jgi:RNA 2',3'-cyclic 3'-phosphodiesterase
MRLFFAIDPSDDARASLVRAQSAVRAALEAAAIRASYPAAANLHLTVRFLGEVADEQIAAIVEAVRSGVRRGPISTSFSEIGVFPNRRSAKVVWIGVDNGASELHDAAEQVDRCLNTLGFAREDRPYKPHLTLARLRAPRRFDPRSVSFSEELASPRLHSRAMDLVLYRSDTNEESPSGGVRYTAIARFPFEEQDERPRR